MITKIISSLLHPWLFASVCLLFARSEREACSTDIAELTWQLKMRRDQLPQVRDRLTHTEVLNRRLKEDIDFMRKHGPLVHERLQLESEIMKQIRTAQSEVCLLRNLFVGLFRGPEINKTKQKRSDVGLTKRVQNVLKERNSHHPLFSEDCFCPVYFRFSKNSSIKS